MTPNLLDSYQTILQSMPSGVTLQLANGPIVLCNPAAESILGLNKEQILGINPIDTTWRTFDAKGDLLDFESLPASKALREAQPQRDNLLYVERPDGSGIWLLVNAEPLFRNLEDKPYAVVSTFNDISKQMASDERYRLLAENATDIISLHNAAGEYLYVSPALKDNLGYLPEDLLGQRFTSLIHPDDVQASIEEIDRQVASGASPIHVRFRLQHKAGHNLWFESRIKLRQGDDDWQMAMRNVHEQVTVEKHIQQQNEILRRNNEELKEFAYVASHDLQEPLRMVSSFLQLLQKRYQSSLDDKAQHYIDLAVSGAHRMQQLIRGLLSYSRIDSKHQARSCISMQEVLEKSLANLTVLFVERDVQFASDPLPQVYGNAIQLGQVLQNLLTNAVKFCTQQPMIYITAREEDDYVVFGVHDNGIGIAPEHQERIFRIFQRLNGRDDFEGNGIGLAVVRKIIEQHKGKIWVSDNTLERFQQHDRTTSEVKQRGSAFYFSLPLHENAKIPEQ